MSAFKAVISFAVPVGESANAGSSWQHSIIAGMNSLPENVYSVAAVREIDRTAIEDAGIPGYTLMTRAGAAAVDAVRRRFANLQRWQVVCGAGNNAGDGYVVARLAGAEGISVSVVALVDPEQLGGDAATAYADYVAAGGVVTAWDGELDPEADLLIDGLLGSGLERDVEGEFAAAVQAMNAHDSSVMALDIPTGLHGDTGTVMGCAVRAALTVTFVGLKSGLFLGDGPEHCGELVFAGLELQAEHRANARVAYRRISSARVRELMPPRPRAAHKGDFGHVLVIGGGAGMPGAAQMCGEAALRAGAGRVSVATHPEHAAYMFVDRPELMAHAISGVKDLDQLLEKADVIAFGPGLGRSEWAGELFTRAAKDQRPAVWDADALNWLAEVPARAANRVITPHPGEAATLLGLAAGQVQADRPAALEQLRERYGGVVVLKGAGSLISSESGAPWLSTAGNPGMATAGMGDVLTGVIAGLMAQGLGIEDAAALGVAVHAEAGDRAAAGGERGLLATDLSAEIRSIVNP